MAKAEFRLPGSTGQRRQSEAGRSVEVFISIPAHLLQHPFSVGPSVNRLVLQAFHGNKELFKSDHLDWCFISTIERKCFVHTLPTYQVQRTSTL